MRTLSNCQTSAFIDVKYMKELRAAVFKIMKLLDLDAILHHE